MQDLVITIIQTNLHWENKGANLTMFAKKIEGIKEKTEIVILPEMFSTGFSMRPELFAEKMPASSGTNKNGETIRWMKETARNKKAVITGSLIIEEAGHYFNRLIWMLPNGEHGFYDKRHLFAFAGEDKHYTPGSKRLIAQAKGWKINLQICYDLRFPVWSRQTPLSPNSYLDGEAQGMREYDLLIYVANWPERRSTAWKTLLQARAIENQCYVIGVNRTGRDGNKIYHSGDSMIIDPWGEILYYKTIEEDVYTFTLKKEKLFEIREKLPFWKDADKFYITE